MLDAQFAEIKQLPQQSKSQAYLTLLASLFPPSGHPDVNAVARFVANIVQDSIGLLITKTVLSELVVLINTRVSQPDLKRTLVEQVLAEPSLAGRTVRFEEQVTGLRETLAGLLEEQEDWSAAAKVLQGIPLDGGHRNVPDEYKLGIYIRIVRLLLEDDDAISAEGYLNRASLLLPTTKDEATILAFKLSHARIFDSKRKFEEASKKYHEISFTGSLAEEEREYCLSAALVCAILAPAGPSRARILTNLFRDERSAELGDYGILAKMFLGQIIRPDELVGFESRLKPHQLARLPRGMDVGDDEEGMEEDGGRKMKRGPETVFDRAVMQHNLLAASKIYNHISLAGLGNLVGLTPAAVEVMARTMVQEKRLRASVDQVERMVTFHTSGENEDDVIVSNVAAAGMSENKEFPENEKQELLASAPTLIKWDESIRKTLQKVESIYQLINHS